MSSQLQTVFWIAGVGATVLFVAFGALVGLLYVLTTVRPFRRTTSLAEARRAIGVESAGAAEDAPGRERHMRAAALAVAVAYAELDHAHFTVPGAPSGWRITHRARRLLFTANRRRLRS